MRTCTFFCVSGEVTGGVFLRLDFMFPFFRCPQFEILDVLTAPRCRPSSGRVPLSLGVYDRVVVPGPHRSGLNKTPITWLDILGDICNFLGIVEHICSLQALSDSTSLNTLMKMILSGKSFGVGSLLASATSCWILFASCHHEWLLLIPRVS